MVEWRTARQTVFVTTSSPSRTPTRLPQEPQWTSLWTTYSRIYRNIPNSLLRYCLIYILSCWVRIDGIGEGAFSFVFKLQGWVNIMSHNLWLIVWKLTVILDVWQYSPVKVVSEQSQVSSEWSCSHPLMHAPPLRQFLMHFSEALDSQTSP